ncbi:hypothetical protein SLEP1_g14231 [Rubroshorea leprosula]|uniref:DUF4220 domain-containing protein n=1 Tax=Rubroshorea leprosula TaxID=152421 RepID=A0AAV5IPD3_9ROSI|nr:hypothetical protein SLEP1_g14231 [Rubroshorea leprosula]
MELPQQLFHFSYPSSIFLPFAIGAPHPLKVCRGRHCSGALGCDFDLDMVMYFLWRPPPPPAPYVSSLQLARDFFNKMKDVRAILLLSLSLQVFLVLVAPLRKSTGKKCLLLIIWSAYMLAQWTATFGVALIIQKLGDNDQGNDEDNFRLCHYGRKGQLDYANTALLSCWASFLLLHLGYTSNIIAFALETREWLSHMYRLIFQVVATLFALALLSFSSMPAILIFIAAVIKNAERTFALYLASQDRFKKPNPDSKYGRPTEENEHHTTAEITTEVGGVLDDSEVIQYAYYSYKVCRGLVFDQIYNFRGQTQIRKLFSSIEAENALRLIEVEVNFFSEVLQTKSEFVHSVKGYVCRFLAFALVATAFVWFQWERASFKGKFDIQMTYSLFLWVIFQEVMAFIMVVFSDWTFAALVPDALPRGTPVNVKSSMSMRIHYHRRDCFSILIDKIIHLSGFVINSLCLALLFEAAADIIKKAIKYLGKHKAFSWPGVIIARGIWSLIIKCLCFIVGKIFQFLLLKDLLDEMKYVSREPLTKDLWKFIFSELKHKSKYADNPRNIRRLCTARGDWVLEDKAWESCSRELIPYLADVSYDYSLLLWHFATELCYNTNTNEVNNESPDECGFCSNNYREFSKILSDHLLYLLLVEPKIMSAVVGIGGIIFQETCNEAERFFTKNGLGPEQLKESCKQILSMNTNPVNEVTSQSVLFDAVNLANKLKTLQKENGVDIWKLLSKVWMEMLSCAAYHCPSHEHAQQLSKGGELISFVWILMAHFGLGGRFQDLRIQNENV